MHEIYATTDGFSVRWVEADELRTIEPRLDDGITRGLWAEGDATVESAVYTQAVLATAVDHGADVVTGAAEGLEVDGDRVVGVHTAGDVLPCADVVVATGPWTDAAGWLGMPLPLEPVKGDLLLVEADGGGVTTDLAWRDMAVYQTASDQVWLGGTEEHVGFDTAPSDAGRARILERIALVVAGDRVRPGAAAGHRAAAGHAGRPPDRGAGRGVVERVARAGRRAQGHAPERGDGHGDRRSRARRLDRPADHPARCRPVRRRRGRRWRPVSFRTQCPACGEVAPADVFSPFCAACGSMNDVEYDLDGVVLHDSPNPYLRYRELLPVRDPSLFPQDAGTTPTVHATRLGERVGLPWLYLKDETKLPTGTTKDRMAAVALPYLCEGGVEGFCTSSTGNSSTAYAHAITSVRGLQMYLFTAEQFIHRVDVPDGDRVVNFGLRDATFVEAFDAARDYAIANGLTSERGFFNPGRREGLKVAWLEAAEQVPRPIDWYVQAVSSAMGVYGVHRAAVQMHAHRRDGPRAPAALRAAGDVCADGLGLERRGRSHPTAGHRRAAGGDRVGDPARQPDPGVPTRTPDRARHRRHHGRGVGGRHPQRARRGSRRTRGSVRASRRRPRSRAWRSCAARTGSTRARPCS